jgi:hypothetical protein
MSEVRTLTIFDQAPLPAYLADLNEVGNIVERETVPQLSFRGKVWRVVKQGEENIISKADGEPAQSVAMVILDYNKARSRAYFPNAYVEGKSEKPTCWSHDGVVPHESVVEKQSPTCASCEQSVKGSRVTPDGREVTACAQFKRIAVVPIQDTTFVPLLLKIPQTSIWDKDAEEYAAQGFYAFDQYMDMIKRRNVNHTAMVVTKIKFDVRTAYPKLLFGAAAFLPQDQYANIRAQLAKVDELNKLLNVDPTGAEVSGEVAGDTGAEEATPAAAPAVPPKAATKAAAPAAPAKTPPAAAKKPPPPAAAAAPADDDEPGTFTLTPTAAAPAPVAARKPPAPPAAAVKKPPAPAAVAAAAPAAAAAEPEVVTETGDKNQAIANMLASWDDEG